MKQVYINNEPTTYFIEEDGRLLNKKTNNWYKGTIRAGYRSYDLLHKGKRYSKQAHRLVAEAFIPNPSNLPIVNHKDGNKLNNIVNNLEWVTASENLFHAYNIGLKEKTNGHSERIKYIDDLDNEIWKPYKDTVYMISNKGRIRSNKTGNILKGKIRADGYLEWCLSIQGKKKSYMAHKLVYETFEGPIEEDCVINHMDGNKANCQLSNLEKVTRSENVIHGVYKLKSNPRIRPVGKYTMNNELLEVYPSCAEAARQNEGCKSNLIVNVCNHKKNSHHGYIWKYINEE